VYSLKKIILAFACLLFLTSCLTQANQQEQADQLVKRAHQAFSQQQWETLLPLYHDDFFAMHPKEAWQQELQQTTSGMGALQHIEPTFRQKDPRFGGDFYLYGFVLQYEHGLIHETLTIYQSIEYETLSIAGHMLKAQKKVHP